jgi:tetrahydromethanopterin S-methyltransferase subunit G
VVEKDDAYREDHASTGRGIMYGVVFGTVLWGMIIAAVVYMLKLR